MQPTPEYSTYIVAVAVTASLIVNVVLGFANWISNRIYDHFEERRWNKQQQEEQAQYDREHP